MSEPCDIVTRKRRRQTRDGRYIVFPRFGLLWVARRPCDCERHCFCNIPPLKLPGGIAGEAFHTLKALQAALRVHYERKGWLRKVGAK